MPSQWIETATFLGDALILTSELGDGWARCKLGRIAVPTGPRCGAAEIMLRPEQVRITPLPSDAPLGACGASECFGVVTDVEFAGATCTIAVAISGSEDSADADSSPTPSRDTSFDLPPVGSRVRITIRGEAHVLAGSGPEGL
jgi:iron(III) transport system ATP-binding protein